MHFAKVLGAAAGTTEPRLMSLFKIDSLVMLDAAFQFGTSDGITGTVLIQQTTG